MEFMNTKQLSETITYCTGTDFELVSHLNGVQRYRCKKCGTTFAQPITATFALPTMHRRDTIHASEMFPIGPFGDDKP